VANYEEPTSIQRKIIPIISKGIDVIGASKSGTGKTAAYLLPMLQKLTKIVKSANKTPRAIVVVPTLELADQVYHSITEFAKYLDIRAVKIQGGVKKAIQLKDIQAGADVVVATPGRLIELIQEKHISLEKVGTVVLDEADTMLELGFLKEITFIFSHCAKPRQIMMFSATISQNIKKLGKEFLREPVIVEVSNRRDVVEKIEHKAYKVDRKRKDEITTYIIKKSKAEQVLLFVNTKETADELTAYLFKKNIRVGTIHGNIKKQDRSKSITMIRNKNIQVLVATDIAARGIDIPELPLVINYDLPEVTDDFTHRVGRTGRAGQKGRVVSLLTIRDYNKFTKIERDLKLSIKRDILDEFELSDRQPRQKIQKKKSLREKKGYVDYDKRRMYTYAEQKRKREENKEKNKSKKTKK
jgi:ATP-dependent RNA helicase RhlE